MARPALVTRSTLTTHGFVDGARVELPVIKVQGARPGKLLVVVAAQHGREVNGPASVYQALQHLNPARMSGTVLLFPVANPLCVRMQVQDFPTERARGGRGPEEHTAVNLNRVWPGRPRGSLPERIAHAIWTGGVRDADCVLDLHSWGSHCLPLSWATASAEPYLTAFGLPWFKVTREDGVVHPGMLEAVCVREGLPCVVCELTPQDIVDPRMVEHGSRGILNLARHLGILPGPLSFPPARYQLDRECSVQVTARQPGLIVPYLRPGDVVPANQPAADLIDLNTLKRVQRAAPPERMVLHLLGQSWGTGQLGYHAVREGELIAAFSGIAREFTPAE